MFFQISGWYVGCYVKIFVLLYFVWKHVIDKTRTHENQRIVLELYLSANVVLKKTWMYKILWIPLKFSKSIWWLSSFLCNFHVWVIRKKFIGFRFHENEEGWFFDTFTIIRMCETMQKTQFLRNLIWTCVNKNTKYWRKEAIHSGQKKCWIV